MKRSDIPLEKVTLNMFSGDADRLRELFSKQGGASFIVRNLVRQYLKRIDEEASQKTPVLSIKIDEREME